MSSYGMGRAGHVRKKKEGFGENTPFRLGIGLGLGLVYFGFMWLTHTRACQFYSARNVRTRHERLSIPRRTRDKGTRLLEPVVIVADCE